MSSQNSHYLFRDLHGLNQNPDFIELSLQRGEEILQVCASQASRDVYKARVFLYIDIRSSVNGSVDKVCNSLYLELQVVFQHAQIGVENEQVEVLEEVVKHVCW